MRETTLDYSASNNQIRLASLKGKYNFILYSVVPTILLIGLFSFFYVQLIGRLPSEALMRNRYVDNFEDQGIRRQMAAEMVPYVMSIGIFGFLAFCSFVCGAVAVSIFYHQAYTNLYNCNIQGLTYSPGMAVGWFYIPLVNLVMPFIVSNQLWKASQLIKSNDIDGNWRGERNNIYILFWFLSLIGFIVFYFIIVSTMMGDLVRASMYQNELEMYNAMQRYFSFVIYGYATSVALQGIFLLIFTRQISQIHGKYAY